MNWKEQWFAALDKEHLFENSIGQIHTFTEPFGEKWIIGETV